MEKAQKEKKMLQRLHVKNLALMEETEVEFTPGLNILTGETGAGKSLLIGSVNLALGAKFEKDFSVKHDYVEKEIDLYKLQCSKYVQSDIANSYKNHNGKEEKVNGFTV